MMTIRPNTIFKLFSYLMILLASSGLYASRPTIVFNQKDALKDVSSSLQYIEDKESSYTIESVQNKEFTLTNNRVLNLGFSNSAYWIKVPITNNSNSNDLFLELSLPILDYIEFYSPTQNDSFAVVKTGQEFPFYLRKYQDPNYLFDITIPNGETRVFYLKIRSTDAIQLPIKIGTREVIYSEIKNRDILSGVYIGVMLVMLFYNLFIFISTKHRSYIYYVIYVLLVLLTQTCLEGYPYQYLWPSKPIIAKYSMFVFPSLVGISSMIFMNVFLNVRHYSHALFNLSYLFSVIYLVPIALAFFQVFDVSQKLMEMTAGIVSVYMLITAIVIAKKGYTPAKYFLVAWVTFLAGVIIFILKDLDVLPYNNFTRYTMQIGSAIETVLLSFALANRINILKKQNTEIIEQQNTILEIKVKERTTELETSNKNLKEAEAILVNSEKMVSLGQLTAGISHEINNPINFVVSNIKPLKRDIQEIITILNKYSEISDPNHLKEKLEEINALKKKLDSDYLVEEINLLLKGIDEGANRTSEIVKGLKNFARTDEADLKFINIQEGIDATLTLLNNSITNGNITVIKNFSDLPNIECYPGKINQVLMNLLSNAIDAVKSVETENHKGVISIETKLDNNNVIIKISDNGIGIPEAIISKIFDPFYTTKDVGKGTGLGLSIVYGITKSHDGKIEVQSEVNKNTTFVITLPIQQKN